MVSRLVVLCWFLVGFLMVVSGESLDVIDWVALIKWVERFGGLVRIVPSGGCDRDVVLGVDCRWRF